MSCANLSKTIFAAYDQIGDLKNSLDKISQQQIADEALLRQALEALEKGETALRFAAIDALKDRLHAR
jgi:hypothetical protein